MNLLDGTTRFMELAGQITAPEFEDTNIRELREVLMEEEINEYQLAECKDDKVEVLDGLMDIIVIAWGTAITYFGETATKAAAEEVVCSNLSKVNGELGETQKREDGKILKPPGWTPPDIKGVLQKAGLL